MDNCLQKKSAQLLKNRTPHRLLAGLFVFVMILTGAWAVDYEWNGSSSDGLWDTAENWTPNGIPGADDQVTLNGNEAITLSDAVEVKFLFIFSGTDSSSLDLAGKTLTVSSRIRLGQDVTGNLVLTNGTVTTAEFDTEDNGTNSLTLNNVSFSVSSRLLLNGNGTTTINGGAGTTNSFNVGSGVTFYEDSAGVITFGSDVTVNSPVTVWNGKIDTDWTNNGNWAFGVPTASSRVIIAKVTNPNKTPVLTSSTAALSELTIADGAKFTLDTGANLLATTITNNGELTIKAGTITATTQTNGNDSTIIYDGVSAPVWNTTDNIYNNLTIKSGSLTIADDITVNKTFTINSDFTNNAEITAKGDVTSTRNMTGSGKITLAGTTAQTFAGGGRQYSAVEIKNNVTITGNNTFTTLTADNAGGKTIDFGTTSQNVTGSLTLKGSGTGAANLLNLTGSSWELNCTGSSDIEYANIDHSTATSPLLAANSTDGGNNTNWIFPGNTYTWTGAVDDDWFTAGNWDKLSIPGIGAEVIIDTTNPAKLNNNVTLSDASYTGKLTINTGAVLDIADKNLVLGSGDFINNGRLRLQGASGQSITATMSNGSSDTSVVEYYGGSSTDFIWNSNQYNNLEITGGAATATALTVTGTTTIAAGTGNVTLTFAGAVTIADNAEAGNLDITCPVINLTKVTTTGTQTYSGSVSGTAIEIDNTGTATFNGNVTATSLSVSGDAAINCASINTSGNQTYNGEISFGAAGGATTLTAKNGTVYNTITLKKSINGSYTPIFDSNVAAILSSGMSVNTSLEIKGNFTDTGSWASAAGKKLIFNGADDQIFTAGSSTYADIELSKASGETITFNGTPTITNLTEDSNTGNIIFDTPVTIQSDTTFATSGIVSFKNATFELSGTKKSITHTNGNTITNGTIDAADITFDTLSLAGNTTLQTSGSATLNGNVNISGGTGISLTIDGAAVINCASITTSGTTTFKGGNVTSTNSSSPEINGDLDIGTSAAGITVSIPLTAKGNVTFNGSNTIDSLTATGLAGKSITFEAEKTQTVNGTLTLRGTANSTGNRLILKSSAAGSPWTIECSGTNNHVIQNVDVKDSNNISSYTLFAATSWDNGHNTKWSFPGMPYEWTGAASSDKTNWDNRDNWSPASVPGKGAVVSIPSGIAGNNYPKLISTDNIDIDNGDTAPETAAHGTITVEGVLDLDGYNIKAKKISNKGRIRLKGTAGQTITAQMENTTDTSIIEYYGGSSTDFIWNSNSYKNLEITGAASTIATLTVTGTTKIAAGTGAVTLNATDNTFAGDIILGDTATSSSAGIVTLSATGTVKFADSGKAESLSITSDTIQIKSIETAGDQTFNGRVVLAANATLIAPAANTILFASTTTTTGAYTLTSSGAPLQFNGNVNIGSLITDAVIINCDLSITTSSGTTFNGDVTETGSHTLYISGPVTIDSGCTAITTSGDQSYTNGTFAVNNACTITSGGNITFSNSANLTATQKLSISAGSTGTINFNWAVGNSDSYFNELEISQAATTTFKQPVYITKISDEPAGIVNFKAGGYLGSDFTHTTAATNITGTLNITGNFTAGAITASGAKITATGTGLITFNGDIAGTSLETTGTSVTINCENIQTSGTQIYNNPVTLGAGTPADRKINGSTLTFNSSINGSKNLELTSTSGTALKGSIGDTTSPISLTVTGPLLIDTGCSGISTSSSQAYKGNVTVASDSSFTTSGAGGNITFETNSTVSGSKTLTLAAGSNSIIFQGYAGNTENHLHELIITSAASTNFDNAVYIDNISDAPTHTGGIVLKNGGNITTIGSDAAGTIHTNGTFTIGQAASAAELNLDSNFTHTAGATEIYGTLTAADKNIYLADTSGNPVHINCNNVILSGNFGSTSGNGSATFGTTSVPTNVQLIPTTASSFGNTNDTISITGNLIHSKGTETVKADVTVTKDLLIFGSSYSETDSTTGITNEYAYASARPASWSQIQYTENTLPDGTAISTASSWSAILKVDSGKTITVSKNFYANGTNLSETSASGTWTLKIPNLTTPAAGFAEAYHSSISNCNVSCTSGSAPASTNGTLARLVALECTNGGSNTNVDFDPFVISSAYTVRDNAIRINFNRPVRFHSTTLDNLKFHDSSNSANGTFNGFFSNPDCTSQLNIGDTFPSEVISGTTYYYCYIKAAPQDSATTGAWNTDATGKSAGATDNKSSDRSGVHHSTKPCLDFPRALSGQPFILTDIWGKRLNNYSGRPSASATEPAYGSTSSTHNVADKTGPVLWTVRTGQELHDAYNTATGEASQHSYDSHNFLEFRYSEPVDIGSGAGTITAYSSGTTPNVVENIQVTDTLGAISENITSPATTLTFAGLAKLTAGSSSSLQLYTGSNGSADKYVNALYRQDPYSIRISIAGWTDGTVTDYAGNTYKKWPGYIESASQFTDATAKAVASTNTLVTDQAGNHQIEYAAGSRTEPTILSDNSGTHTAALLPDSPDLYSPWDISEPVFTPLRFSSETDWGDQTMAEAIGNTNGSGSTLDRIDFHFFDNTPAYSLSGSNADEAVWYSQIGWCNTTGEASKSNLKDYNYTYCADIVGGSRQFNTDPTCRTTGGIRFSTKADIASTFTSAFKYSTNINNPSPSNSFQNGIAYMYTTVVSQLFTGSSNPMRPANDPDGLYMGLGLTDSNLSVDTTFSFSYSESLGYLTDLAGNRLRSKISKTIDRTPPSFDVIISPIDTKSIYILFVKQIVTDSTKIRYRLNYATTDTPITVDFDTLIPRCFRIISIDSSGQPVLSTENQIDTSTPAQIVENFSNESFTCIKLTTTKEINIDNLKNLYIQLINHPDYEEQSSDPLTNNIDCRVTFIQDYLGNYMSMYSTHALSDFAVNYVNPLYAYSTDMLYEDQSIMNGLYEAGSWAVHDWNADQQNYGTLPAGYPISIVADTKGDEKIRVYLSPSPDADSVSKQFNSDFDVKFRIWLPALQDSLFRALSAANNTNFVYSDGQLLDASSANSLFNITKETVSSWQSGSQISFMFGLMQNSNSPVRIYNNPYYDVSTDKFNLSLSIPVPLYCLRMPDTADLNTLDLWSFKIKGITAQRGGVTILNNVINASNDEKAVVIVDMPEDGNLTVCVMTLDGNVITYLNRGNTKAGEYYYTWNGKNRNGKAVARGMYFVRVLGGGIDETRKVMVVK